MQRWKDELTQNTPYVVNNNILLSGLQLKCEVVEVGRHEETVRCRKVTESQIAAVLVLSCSTPKRQ